MIRSYSVPCCRKYLPSLLLLIFLLLSLSFYSFPLSFPYIRGFFYLHYFFLNVYVSVMFSIYLFFCCFFLTLVFLFLHFPGWHAILSHISPCLFLVCLFLSPTSEAPNKQHRHIPISNTIQFSLRFSLPLISSLSPSCCYYIRLMAVRRYEALKPPQHNTQKSPPLFFFT